MSDEKKEIAIRGQGLELATFSDLQRFAACVVDSFKVGKPCVPSCYNTLPQAQLPQRNQKNPSRLTSTTISALATLT